MKVIALQLDIVWEDKASNFAKVERMLAEAAPPRDALVVLPEMFATGFSMNAAGMAEKYGGATEQFLAGTARKYGIGLLGGAAVISQDGRARNKALVYGPSGELLSFYAKMRPFTPGGEPAHYAAGQNAVVFEFGQWSIAPFICYDLRFPELFREAAAARRPELYVVIASWPEKRKAHWIKLLQARAIENQAYVAGVNRVGSDPHYRYAGRSLVIDPQGEIVADAGETEGWIGAELDLDGLRKYREGLPFLKDLLHSLETVRS